MTNPVWLFFILLAFLMWTATSPLYRVGAVNIAGGKEEHICLKFSVCVGMVFFVIALAYLIMREEPFAIWESAVKYWPMTLFGIVLSVYLNTHPKNRAGRL